MNRIYRNISKLILGFILISTSYSCNYGNNIANEGKLYIPTDASFDQIVDSISPRLEDPKSFADFAKSKHLDTRYYPGRYSIKKGMSNRDIVKLIQEGKQDEISIRIGNYPSITVLAAKMGTLLEADSAQLVQAMVQASYASGLDTAAQLYFYIPNTYNFHWNTSGKQFSDKMYEEFTKFWTPDRLAKAKAANMSPLAVTTLASIVQLESAKPDEQARVASLYLNRLKIGMKLDADPTVIFVKKMRNGFSEKVSRVYYKDLAIESPYNTYRNKGLPPGPICMPNPSAIDAVLSPEQHDFIYFVADTARPGYHRFAKTLAEQEVNANAYRAWANKNNVK